MKVTKFLWVLLAVSALTVACTKEYYIDGGGENGVQMSHVDFTINSSDWEEKVLDTGASYVGVQLNVPEITKNVVNYGTVTVSCALKDENKNTVWTPLPIVSPQYIDYGTEDQYLYSTILDYEWSEGKVTVFYTATDFQLDESGDPTLKLRVTIWQYK